MIESLDAGTASILVGEEFDEACDYLLETDAVGISVIAVNRETGDSTRTFLHREEEVTTKTPIWEEGALQAEAEMFRRNKLLVRIIAGVISVGVVFIAMVSYR